MGFPFIEPHGTEFTARIPYNGKPTQIRNEEMKEFQMDCHYRTRRANRPSLHNSFLFNGLD